MEDEVVVGILVAVKVVEALLVAVDEIVFTDDEKFTVVEIDGVFTVVDVEEFFFVLDVND